MLAAANQLEVIHAAGERRGVGLVMPRFIAAGDVGDVVEAVDVVLDGTLEEAVLVEVDG